MKEQRELKFRAFIKNELGGFMIPDDGDCFMVSNGGGFGVYDEYKNTLHEDRFVIMQFIGKKDKNGKEIYEGDVIRCNNQNCVVVFGKKTLGFGYHVKYNTSWNVVDKFYRINSKDEVIGNIYENPELLT